MHHHITHGHVCDMRPCLQWDWPVQILLVNLWEKTYCLQIMVSRFVFEMRANGETLVCILGFHGALHTMDALPTLPVLNSSFYFLWWLSVLEGLHALPDLQSCFLLLQILSPPVLCVNTISLAYPSTVPSCTVDRCLESWILIIPPALIAWQLLNQALPR